MTKSYMIILYVVEIDINVKCIAKTYFDLKKQYYFNGEEFQGNIASIVFWQIFFLLYVVLYL